MPLRSMTGFGQSEASTPSGTYRVEIRGVNNRFLEQQLRVPKFMSNLEPKIKQAVSANISRGSVLVFVTCADEEAANRLTWNRTGVENYIRILREIQDTFHLAGDVSISELVGFSDLIKSEATDRGDDMLWSHVEPILAKALKDFQVAREKEASQLERDIRTMLKTVTRTVRAVEKRSPVRVRAYRDAMVKRIADLMSGQPDPQRMMQEAAVMAEKLDISEECARLQAHIETFVGTFAATEPVGKRMNFLLQEMNREANTIGSKANDTGIAQLSVDLKEFIEKIREQIQNIE